jgi:hypothetical protein
LNNGRLLTDLYEAYSHQYSAESRLCLPNHIVSVALVLVSGLSKNQNEWHSRETAQEIAERLDDLQHVLRYWRDNSDTRPRLLDSLTP